MLFILDLLNTAGFVIPLPLSLLDLPHSLCIFVKRSSLLFVFLAQKAQPLIVVIDHGFC